MNETRLRSGDLVPATVSARWLLERRPFDWFDVLHLHHVEFEDVGMLADVLHECAASGVRVVFTAHDLRPMFNSAEEFASKLRLLASSAEVRWVFLTRGSAAGLAGTLEAAPHGTVIPHGYVVPPNALRGRERATAVGAHRFLMYGAARPNRDQVSTLVNWSLGYPAPSARLHLLLRAFSPADFADQSNRVPTLLSVLRSDPRIRTTMRPYPTDQEVVEAALDADALLLPYLWGSHSGQLELAFDLNLLPICSSVGYFHEQYAQHRGLIREPEWFDWSEGLPYLHGEKFLAALDRAVERLDSDGRQGLDAAFGDYRREEHKAIIAAYAQVYGADHPTG